MKFTNEIKIAMIKKEITQGELARRLQTSPQSLSNKMKSDNWRLDDLNNIAAALDVKLIVKLDDGIAV